jgi:hypothetical protein
MIDVLIHAFKYRLQWLLKFCGMMFLLSCCIWVGIFLRSLLSKLIYAKTKTCPKPQADAYPIASRPQQPSVGDSNATVD